MAKHLVIDKTKNLTIKMVKQGNPSNFYEGKESKRFVEFGNISILDLKKKIQSNISNLQQFPQFRDTISDLQSNGFLKDETLAKLSNKEIKCILKVLSKMSMLCKDYAKKEKVLQTPMASVVKQKYDEAMQTYCEALTGISTGMSGVEKLHDFDTEAFAKSIKDFTSQLGKTPNNLDKSYADDLRVVRALEYVGINLKREKVSENSSEIIWKLDEQLTNKNTNGISYEDENGETKYFKLDAAQINSFLEQYLNKPYTSRGGALITPDGIFKLYLEEASSGVKRVFGKNNKFIDDAIKSAETKYSSKNADWKAFELNSERTQVADGAKLALMDLYAKLGLQSNVEDIISQDLQDKIQSNNLVNNKWLNKLAVRAETYINACTAEMQTIDNFVGQNITEKYQNNVEDLNIVNIVRDFAFEVAHELSQNDKKSWMTTINLLSDSDLLDISKTHDGFYEISISDRNNVLSMQNGLADICNGKVAQFNEKLKEKAYQATSGNLNTSQTERMDSVQDLDGRAQEFSEEDIFAILFDKSTENEANNLGTGIKEWALYDFTDNYLQNCSENNECKQLIDKYRQLQKEEPDNPKYATLKTFFESTYPKEDQADFGSPLFNIDSLSNYEVRTRANNPEYQASNAYKNAQSEYDKKSNNANIFFARLARTRSNLANLSPDITLEDITPENFQNAYSRALNESRSPEFKLNDDELKIAKLYKDYTKKSFAKNALEGYMNGGNDITDGKPMSKDLLNTCSKIFTDKELEKQIADIRAQNQALSGQEAEKVVSKIKFSEKYPKDKTAKLLKKFKPYSDKSTGKIIEKMMEMIEKCDLLIEKKTPPKDMAPPTVNNNAKQESQQEDKEEKKSPNNVDNKALDNSEDKTPQTENKENNPTIDNSNDVPQTNDTSNERPAEENTNSNKFVSSEDNASVFEDNTIGLPDGEFATYKILSVGLKAVVNAESFLVNVQNWLNDQDITNIKALSEVMQYIIAPSIYEKGSEKYEKDQQLKKFMAGELDLKAKLSPDRPYNAGKDTDVADFYREEFGAVFEKDNENLINNIYCVMKNYKNEEDIGQFMLITTDPSAKKFQIGNKLSKEDIQKIASFNSEKELWEYIRINNKIYRDLWYLPGAISTKLKERLIQLENAEHQNQSQNNQDEKPLTSPEELKPKEQDDLDDDMVR